MNARAGAATGFWNAGQTGRSRRALVLSGAAAALYSRDDDELARPRVAVAFGLQLAAVVIIVAVHERLNGKLRDVGDRGDAGEGGIAAKHR